MLQCPECHAEKEDHGLKKTNDMHFICKKCRRAFRKDMTHYEESDEYCPHCDNHYVSNLIALFRHTLAYTGRAGDRSQDAQGYAGC